MKTQRMISFIAGLVLGASVMTPAQAVTYTSPLHTFSINDVQGGFTGSTFGTSGAVQDTSILCDAPGSSSACPPEVSPIVSPKMPPGSGTVDALYPIDSEFGFYVVDFLGGARKIRDGDYLEGFVGDITGSYPPSAEIDGNPIAYAPPIAGGIAVSDAATDTYKAKTPLGSWCRGLGGNSVKCETEHYSVLEHVLSCHEVIPYFFANPETGAQGILPLDPFPVDFGTTDCSLQGLDDVLNIISGGVDTGIRLTDATVGVQMLANDKTDLKNDIAVSSDYAVRLKADGKANYTWGGMVKLPNDVRLYARLALPDEWKQAGANYPVTAAKLVVRHTITNNPNDQLRPEDIENEAATGRKPSYSVTATASGDVWKSTLPCYEGDGDYIETDEGGTEPVPIAAGTVLKNTPFAFTGYNVAFDLYAFSGDLVKGFTNAYYTTINRDPFEWSYDPDGNPADATQNYVGSWLQNDSLGALVTGPRWRLRPNKFGQDLPGLEIPLIECSPPPFEKDNIKYNVGVQTITEINLLDWDEVTNGPSPLATTIGWVDVTQNGVVEIADTVNGVPVTTNGLPMTDDFDLAVYIKGDKKPVALYDAQLVIEWDNTPIPVPVIVPNIVGQSYWEAQATLAPDLLIGIDRWVCSDTYLIPNTVITQDPVAGTTASVGDTVDVVLSTGACAPGVVTVPSIVGQTFWEAQATLAPDLLINITKWVCSDIYLVPNTVVTQDPTAGVAVDVGSTVNVTLSYAPCTPPADLSDVSITSVQIPASLARVGVVKTLSVTVTNDATAAGAGTGTVTLRGTDGSVFTGTFTNLVPGASKAFSWNWTVPSAQTLVWTINVTVNGVVVDSATRTTQIR